MEFCIVHKERICYEEKRIVADSSANIFQDDFVNFIPVPLKILAGEKEYVDDKALDVAGMLSDPGEYKGRSGTACPSVGDWLQAFGDAEDYRAEHPERKVFILDSLSTGPELELLIKKYCELIESGYPFDVIQDKSIEYLKRTHLAKYPYCRSCQQ